MKILLIGSEGFIGKSCINHFLTLKYKVFGADLLDVKNSNYQYYKISRLSPSFEDIFKNVIPDICINAAGSGSVPLSITNPRGDFEANTIDTFTLLDCIKNLSPNCKYINLSSAAVYGNPNMLPINENSPVKPLSPYGWHKYYSELICKEFYELYDIQTCSIRPFSVYGPGLKKQLFWDLYQKCRTGNNNITLFGSGKESRDFIYINDLVKLIDIVVHRNKLSGEVINAANGIEITIEYVSRVFFSYFKKPAFVEFNNEERIGDPKNWLADIELAKSWGYKPETSIEDGLLLYYKWVINN